MPAKKKVRRHGTIAKYYRGRCRCHVCRAAALKYQQAWKARNPDYHKKYRMLGRDTDAGGRNGDAAGS